MTNASLDSAYVRTVHTMGYGRESFRGKTSESIHLIASVSCQENIQRSGIGFLTQGRTFGHSWWHTANAEPFGIIHIRWEKGKKRLTWRIALALMEKDRQKSLFIISRSLMDLRPVLPSRTFYAILAGTTKRFEREAFFVTSPFIDELSLNFFTIR